MLVISTKIRLIQVWQYKKETFIQKAEFITLICINKSIINFKNKLERHDSNTDKHQHLMHRQASSEADQQENNLLYFTLYYKYLSVQHAMYTESLRKYQSLQCLHEWEIIKSKLWSWRKKLPAAARSCWYLLVLWILKWTSLVIH